MKPVSGGPQMSASATRRADERALTRHGWSPVRPASTAGAVRQPTVGWWRGRTRGGRRKGTRSRDQGGRPRPGREPGGHSSTQAVAGGADALGMAGGDGSLAVVAAAAAANGLPFICVPAGTRNHFALDLGVDRHDVAGASTRSATGVERLDRPGRSERPPFLNNVSLGDLRRGGQPVGLSRRQGPHPCADGRRVLGSSGETPALRLVDDAGREHAQLAVVLVSNNPYALDTPFPGTRPSLDSGRAGHPHSRRTRQQGPRRGAPGAHQTSRSLPPPRCMRASMARR